MLPRHRSGPGLSTLLHIWWPLKSMQLLQGWARSILLQQRSWRLQSGEEPGYQSGNYWYPNWNHEMPSRHCEIPQHGAICDNQRRQRICLTPRSAIDPPTSNLHRLPWKTDELVTRLRPSPVRIQAKLPLLQLQDRDQAQGRIWHAKLHWEVDRNEQEWTSDWFVPGQGRWRLQIFNWLCCDGQSFNEHERPILVPCWSSRGTNWPLR